MLVNKLVIQNLRESFASTVVLHMYDIILDVFVNNSNVCNAFLSDISFFNFVGIRHITKTKLI